MKRVSVKRNQTRSKQSWNNYTLYAIVLAISASYLVISGRIYTYVGPFVDPKNRVLSRKVASRVTSGQRTCACVPIDS